MICYVYYNPASLSFIGHVTIFPIFSFDLIVVNVNCFIVNVFIEESFTDS